LVRGGQTKTLLTGRAESDVLRSVALMLRPSRRTAAAVEAAPFGHRPRGLTSVSTYLKVAATSYAVRPNGLLVAAG